MTKDEDSMADRITYAVSITTEGHGTYYYHLLNEQAVRDLFESIAVPVADFVIYEQQGAVMAEMTYSQIARLLEPLYAAA